MEGDRQPRELAPAWQLAITCAVALAFSLKIAIALTTYGSNDVYFWEWFLDRLRQVGGIGLYRSVDPAIDTKIFNHPPFMIHALRVMDFLASSTALPFPFWLRLPAIVADVGSTLVVWKILQTQGDALSPGRLLLLAVAPASVMISGFHGNTDPVMIFFVLLSIYLLDRRESAWLAGMAFGMGINIKVVPVIFLPAIISYLRGASRRGQFLIAAGAVVVAGSLPYIARDPVFIARRTLGYGSFPGQWGLSRTLGALPAEFAWLNTAYATQGRFAALALIVAASLWMNRSLNRPPLFLQCGLVAFLFMALTPGFGVQYLAWLVPWVVGLSLWATLLYYAASGAFLFLVYTYWSQGFPWYLADSLAVAGWHSADVAPAVAWHGYIAHFERLCWAVVVVVLLAYLHRLVGMRAKK